jgi:hypothetical protein
MSQGHALGAYAIEHNGMVSVERDGPGYIRQEIEALLRKERA